MRARLLAAAVSIVALPFVLVGAAQRTPPAARGDWPSYRGNVAGTGYSALAAIDRSTVTRLQRAWTFPLGAASGSQPSGATTAAVNSQATPIVIGGSTNRTTVFIDLKTPTNIRGATATCIVFTTPQILPPFTAASGVRRVSSVSNEE